jgi:Ca2+-binding RTX toxin-like protein
MATTLCAAQTATDTLISGDGEDSLYGGSGIDIADFYIKGFSHSGGEMRESAGRGSAGLLEPDK